VTIIRLTGRILREHPETATDDRLLFIMVYEELGATDLRDIRRQGMPCPATVLRSRQKILEKWRMNLN
jgi:hypothetical protein